ncbi:Hypothetical protein Ccan_11630 [Capnocytophaga canimorsus Cc5]|uniref:Uncharacterized protein n=1 Tax=Capnocytophaga canimorsus (strain 5) TaxID=860228 RepID=F9YP85_CAPCC|nr:Hypothetical protein Ccan_11630 [Capnocytophaga canimorsus Cc5]
MEADVGTALILEGNHNRLVIMAGSKQVGTALILEGNHNL